MPVEHYPPEVRVLLRRAAQARHAIRYDALEPEQALLWVIYPEWFPEVQEAVREQERTAA